MAQHVETLVIGAGPAGLTTAYTLAKAGRGVTVLEMDPVYVGGISRTVDYKGFKFDIGGHRFFSKSQEIVDLWNEILPDDFIDRPRLSRIYYREKFYAYPLKAFEALANLGVWTAAKCMTSFGWAKFRPIETPTTFHEWVRNQFGEKLFSIFFKTYTEKVWGMSCDEISADWASQRIKGLDLAAAIIDGVKRSLGVKAKASAEGAPKTLIESFRYPRKGPGMMWEACAAKIGGLGGQIRMGRKVDGLHYDKLAKIWTVSVSCADGKKEIYTADDVVSSAPIRELMQAVSPTPISVFHAGELMYRDFLTVVLIGKPQKELPDNWIYIHDPSVKVGRVQNFRSWSPEMIPDGVSTCLGLEYFCFEGDGLWIASDEELVAQAKREIGKIGLMDPADVYDACVVRQHKAYPVYDDAYAEHIKMIRLDLKMHFPGLHLVGRNGMHKYNNQDHAMMTGLLTAENIIAGEVVHDVWEVNEDAEYGEAGVSGAREALRSERAVPKKVAALIMGLALQLWRRLPEGLRELLLYGLASALALAIDWGLLLGLTKAGVNYLVASGIGFTSGIAVTYLLSVSVVFRHRPVADRKREFFGFIGVGLAGLVLTQGLMALWVEALRMTPGLAKIPTAGIVFLFNFTLRRALLFRARRFDAASL